MKMKFVKDQGVTVRRKFRFVEGKERRFVYLTFILIYLLFFVFAILFYSNMAEKAALEMKFASEKSFNSIYMALNESEVKALNTMQEEKVSAIGVYNSRGVVYEGFRLGEAPDTLPLTKLAANRRNITDSTLGMYFFDEESKQIEYIRFSRFTAMLETGTIRIPSDGKVSTVETALPEIIYIRFDGTQYFKTLQNLRVMIILTVVLLSAVVLYVDSIYEANRKFRIELEKNKNLANLGSAARTLTHEIKNPLAAMTIQSAILRKTLPKEYSEDLDVFDHEINRLTSLTNRVSEFLKNPEGSPSDIQVVPFLHQIISLFHRDIPLISDKADNLWISFDPDLARSVFENLIKNALESCQERDPQVSVTVSARRGRKVLVCVSDRGDGISEQALEKLFDPFYTTKIHGSGIGLSISRQFVNARGGSLRLRNREGGGTCAEVLLPCFTGDEK